MSAEYIHGKVIPVTQVRVTLVEGDQHMVGLANITLGGCFVVNRVRIVKGANGLFVAMPQRKNESNEFKDVAHPITSEMRKAIDEAVMAEYKKKIGEGGEEQAS